MICILLVSVPIHLKNYKCSENTGIDCMVSVSESTKNASIVLQGIGLVLEKVVSVHP